MAGIEEKVTVDTAEEVSCWMRKKLLGTTGVTELEALDAVDVPLAFVAVTVNV